MWKFFKQIVDCIKNAKAAREEEQKKQQEKKEKIKKLKQESKDIESFLPNH